MARAREIDSSLRYEFQCAWCGVQYANVEWGAVEGLRIEHEKIHRVTAPEVEWERGVRREHKCGEAWYRVYAYEDGGEWVWEVDDEVEGIRGVVFCPFCGERLRGDE